MEIEEKYSINHLFSSINEGDSFTTYIESSGLEEGSKLYWKFFGEGINSVDIYKGYLSGFGIIDSNGAFSFSHTISEDLITEGWETLKINLYSDKKYSTQLGATASLTIKDTSKELKYTNKSGEDLNISLRAKYGTLIDNVSFEKSSQKPIIEGNSSNISISETSIDFSLKLNNSAINAEAKTTSDLTPFLDDLTTKGKYLAYFSYEKSDNNQTPIASTLTYDPTKKAGARFYDLDGDGFAETADLQLVDGGYGDKDGVKNGTIVDPSTAGTVVLTPTFSATTTALTVADENDTTSPAALLVRASIATSAESVNQIGYVALNSTEGDTLTYDLIKDRGSILLSNLENKDTPDVSAITFQRDISLINGQKLVFFEVVDTTLQSLLANNTTLEGFGGSFKTLDLSDVSTSAATASKGGNSVSLALIDGVSGLDDLISSEMDSDPILDFTGLAGRDIKGTVSLSREASHDSVVGFYTIQNANGAVLDPITGNLITPDADGYATAALDSSNLFSGFGTLSTDNKTTKTNTIASFSEAELIAPYVNITTTGETFFSFAAANSDGLTHFRSLGSGVIGVEDLKGGGDQDFDDLILGFDFQLAA